MQVCLKFSPTSMTLSLVCRAVVRDDLHAPSQPSMSPCQLARHPKLNAFQNLLAPTLDMIESSLIVPLEKKRVLPQTVDPAVQLSGNFAPVQECPIQEGLDVVGQIPHSLHGVYLRNGANPMFEPTGGHHLFDGDGMIHVVKLVPENQASYSCSYVRTSRLEQQVELGRQVFPKPIGELHGHLGLARLALFMIRARIGLIDDSRGIGVANAGLVYFNGRLLALAEDDLPYHIKINDDGVLRTIGQFNFSGELNSALIPHPKLDPETDDMHVLSYNVIEKPYLRYLKFDKRGKKSREVAITLDQPTMTHDFAITKNFILISDHQMVFQLSEMIRGGSPVNYDKTKTSRFGILHKKGINESEILWIDVPKCFCFHFCNAWEEDNDTIIVTGSCMNPPDSIFNESEKPLRSELTEIQLNMRTGKSSQRIMVSGMNLETGQVSKNQSGKKTQFAYFAIAEPWPRCSGIAKVDMKSGDVTKFMYGPGKFGGEPLLVGDDDSEEGGYVIGFVTHEEKEMSELVIVNTLRMEEVASVKLPCRVPYGFHATFITHQELEHQTS